MTNSLQNGIQRLVLGTANWGASYGAPGREAIVDEVTAHGLAEVFLSAGHDTVDTAPAYGRAEEMVGSVLNGAARVVNKVPSSVLKEGSRAPEVAIEGLRRSLRHTRVQRFAGVLLHDHAAASERGGVARSVIEAIRSEELADRVGISVYEPQEAYAAVDDAGADLVQIPCNLLDQRFRATGCVRELVAAGVEVHVRSVFLNGVLLTDPRALQTGLAPLAPLVGRVSAEARRLGTTPLQLALGFVRAAVGCHAVVVGAYNVPQLRDILAAWDSNVSAIGAAKWEFFSGGDVPEIDPRTWRNS